MSRQDLSSKPPRVLVTGAGGLLGGRLAALLSRTLDVTGAVQRSPAPPGLRAVALDLLDEPALERTLEATGAQAVLHCAALAEPGQCEREPERASRLNAGLPRTLARLCARHGLRLVAVSTDLVFDGTRPSWREEDAARPVLHYGHSKLAGERGVLELCPAAAVARVPLVLGRGHGPRGTASEAIAWALRSGRRLQLFSDQVRTPVDPESLAQAFSRLLAGAQAGTFHLGGPERLSRHALGLRVAAVLGLDAGLVDEARQSETPLPAPRPADVSLDSSRARRELGWTPRPLDEAIREGRLDPPL